MKISCKYNCKYIALCTEKQNGWSMYLVIRCRKFVECFSEHLVGAATCDLDNFVGGLVSWSVVVFGGVGRELDMHLHDR